MSALSIRQSMYRSAFCIVARTIVLLLLAILFAWRYPIGREQHRALRDELATRDHA